MRSYDPALIFGPCLDVVTWQLLWLPSLSGVHLGHPLSCSLRRYHGGSGLPLHVLYGHLGTIQHQDADRSLSCLGKENTTLALSCKFLQALFRLRLLVILF